MLAPIALNGKVVSGGRIGYAHTARFCRREIDDARIEREKLIVTPAVERKVLASCASTESALLHFVEFDSGIDLAHRNCAIHAFEFHGRAQTSAFAPKPGAIGLPTASASFGSMRTRGQLP